MSPTSFYRKHHRSLVIIYRNIFSSTVWLGLSGRSTRSPLQPRPRDLLSTRGIINKENLGSLLQQSDISSVSKFPPYVRILPVMDDLGMPCLGRHQNTHGEIIQSASTAHRLHHRSLTEDFIEAATIRGSHTNLEAALQQLGYRSVGKFDRPGPASPVGSCPAVWTVKNDPSLPLSQGVWYSYML